MENEQETWKRVIREWELEWRLQRGCNDNDKGLAVTRELMAEVR